MGWIRRSGPNRLRAESPHNEITPQQDPFSSILGFMVPLDLPTIRLIQRGRKPSGYNDINDIVCIDTVRLLPTLYFAMAVSSRDLKQSVYRQKEKVTGKRRIKEERREQARSE